MAKVKEIRDYFNREVPFYMAMGFDNVGLLAGYCNADVTRVLTALDITDAVIEEAASCGAQLIVSHHPLIFDPIKRVTDDDAAGRKLIRILTGGMSAICLHTNLDTAEGGVNDILMGALGGRVTGLLEKHGCHPDGRPYGVARIGELEKPMEFHAFLERTKQSLGTTLRYVDGARPVKKLACCGGAGGDEIDQVIASGCDTYVTADLKYHQFLRAKEAELNLIDGDHFCTENLVVPHIRDLLVRGFPDLDVRISNVHAQAVEFY